MEDGFKIPVSNSKRELLLKKEEKMNTALIIIMTLMN
ncbi:MAG: hypothetical protein ACJAT4_001850 [Granulosicoccus sp.]|jgi:hypothetical protein